MNMLRASKIHRTLRNKKNSLLTRLWFKMMFKKLGKNSCISAPFYPHNTENIEIGERVFIGTCARIEAHPVRPEDGHTVVTIGNRVVMGQNVTISGSTSLIIGDDVLIAGGSYISDNNHGMNPLGKPYLHQPIESSPTEIGPGVWLGQGVSVLAGSNIGERSIIGSGSVVTGTIPPFCIAAGVPARVLKQFCFNTNTWKRVESTAKIAVVSTQY